MFSLGLLSSFCGAVLLLSSTSVTSQSDGKFCTGELGETGWDCESLGTIPADQLYDVYSTLPGSPDPSNPVVYKQIAGEPAFDSSGNRVDSPAIFVLYDAATYFCMLIESNGEAALFDAPEGG